MVDTLCRKGQGRAKVAVLRCKVIRVQKEPAGRKFGEGEAGPTEGTTNGI